MCSSDLKPFTRIFDYSNNGSEEYVEMMDIVGHFDSFHYDSSPFFQLLLFYTESSFLSTRVTANIS